MDSSAVTIVVTAAEGTAISVRILLSTFSSLYGYFSLSILSDVYYRPGLFIWASLLLSFCCPSTPHPIRIYRFILHNVR
jgi:hypothetical protein